MDSRAAKTVMARVATERVRSLAPVVLLVQVFTFAMTESVGVPIGRAVIAYNIIGIALLGAVTWQAWRRRLEGTVHVALALLWLVPVGGTLMSAADNGDSRLISLVVIELVCVAIYVCSILATVSVCLALGAYIPLLVRDAPHLAGLGISVLVTAGAFGIMLQILVRRSLLQAEAHRNAQAELAAQLAQRLDELERTDRERARLEDRVMHAQRLEAIATLAAGMAHDINNMLAAITNHAAVVRTTDPQDTALVRSIIEQAERGAELTRGVLAYSSQGQYRKQRVRLGRILDDVLPILERTVPQACTLEVRSGAADLVVEVDRVQVGQVIANLCHNASDAMPDGGRITVETARVTLDADAARERDLAAGRYARIEVTDTGTGMDEATRARVFEPFFTTKPRGTGTGLGLSMAWGIVHGHGGTIDVVSELGRGTRVAIYLPESTLAESTSLPRSAVATMPATAARSRTILVVDDELPVRRGTARILSRRGYQVLTAGDGAEALTIFARHAAHIGLVILDMNMPVMNGEQCFAALREQSNVPILIATGYATDTALEVLVAQGAMLIEKPYQAHDLLDRVAQVLTSPDERSGDHLAPRSRDTPSQL